MSGGQLNANVDQYQQAAAMNTPPPQIVSDPLVSGVTPIEQLLRALGIAANMGDAADNAKSIEQHAERDAKAEDAAAKFAAQDEQATEELKAIADEPVTAPPEQVAAAAQQLPQMASSIAGALAGAVGGALQPLAQIPQQAGQGLQQAVQAGMGLFQQVAGSAAALVEDAGLTTAPLAEEFGGDLAGLGSGEIGGAGGELGDLGGLSGIGAGVGPAAGGAGLGGTTPTAYLGPPPVPSASTAPSSAPATPIAPSSNATSPPPAPTGMAGMPMVPPGAVAGAGSDKDAKADTKRVSVPPVRNGVPVQGRLSPPAALPPVTKSADRKPVVTRRVVAPGSPDGNHSADPKPDS